MRRRSFFTTDLSDLSSAIRAALEHTCPNLTLEQRTIFAVQIALAEVRGASGITPLVGIARDN